MSKSINRPFILNAPYPIDVRLQVSTYANLALIAIKYQGLKTYVVDEDKEYRYYTSTGWQEWNPSGVGGSGAWGSITGTLSTQTDLNDALNLKFDKSGGTITGKTTVLDDVEAVNFIIFGSTPTAESPYLEVVDPPASAISTGTPGQVAYESGWFYVCVAVDTWERTAISTW